VQYNTSVDCHCMFIRYIIL